MLSVHEHLEERAHCLSILFMLLMTKSITDSIQHIVERKTPILLQADSLMFHMDLIDANVFVYYT